MEHEYQITLDNLIKDELDGKSAAIAGYDDMLWKIRTGYAALLYGAVGVIVGLVSQQILALGKPTMLAVNVLILGFSMFGAVMDYSFMASKLRVIDYRDKLLELAYQKATSGAWPQDHPDLLECLKNSGERKGRIDWSKRTGRMRPLIYYGGTCIFCIIATWFLV